jgi:hypothetical protein
MLPANSCIPHCQRRAPGFRATVAPWGNETFCFTALVSLRSAPLSAGPALFAPDGRFEDRHLTPESPSGCGRSRPHNLPARSCFPLRLVNGSAFRSTERLPPASSPPRTVPTRGCRHRASLVDTFRPQLPILAVFLLWARSPWAPPAATGEACLDRCRFLASAITRKTGHTERAAEPHTETPFPAIRSSWTVEGFGAL